MYCGKCGTQINGDALFCPNCGEKTVVIDANTQMKSETGRKKFALLLGIVAGVILIVVLTVLLIGGGGYKRTLDNYYKAHENNDADLMYNSVVAQYWIDYMNEGWGDSAYETIQDSIEDNIDEWNCGSDIKITYKVRSKRQATKEQLEELEDNIYDRYAYYVYDRDEFSITDAYVLDINFTVKSDERTESFHYPDGRLIIKENGKWRIARGSISCSFYDN